MSASPTRSEAAETTDLDRVLELLDADRRCDAPDYGALLHDDVVVRVDGDVVALGRDGAVALQREAWQRRDDCTIDTTAVDAAPPDVFVRFAQRRGAHVHAVGYSVYELTEGRILVASHFVRELARPRAEPALAEAPPEAREPPTEAADAPGEPDEARLRRRPWAMPVVGVASWLAQDAFLAAPVIAATAKFGAGTSFAVLGTAYFAGSLAASLIALRLLARRGSEGSSRVARWLQGQVHDGLILRALRAGGRLGAVAGFVVGSYFMSAAPMVWALHDLGVRRRLKLLAVVSSAIWAAGFVAFYTGLAKLLGL